MKLSCRADVAAPSDFVFSRLADFGKIEYAALRRGAEVQRIDSLGAVAPGMSWSMAFRWRGRMRRGTVTLTRYEPSVAIGSRAETTGFLSEIGISLADLSRGRTRMIFEAEVRPRTIAARLMIQSARLGRAGLERRFQSQIDRLARELETAWADAGEGEA